MKLAAIAFGLFLTFTAQNARADERIAYNFLRYPNILNYNSCSGSLVNFGDATYFLTARHCFETPSDAAPPASKIYSAYQVGSYSGMHGFWNSSVFQFQYPGLLNSAGSDLVIAKPENVPQDAKVLSLAADSPEIGAPIEISGFPKPEGATVISYASFNCVYKGPILYQLDVRYFNEIDDNSKKDFRIAMGELAECDSIPGGAQGASGGPVTNANGEYIGYFTTTFGDQTVVEGKTFLIYRPLNQKLVQESKLRDPGQVYTGLTTTYDHAYVNGQKIGHVDGIQYVQFVPRIHSLQVQNGLVDGTVLSYSPSTGELTDTEVFVDGKKQ